MGWVVVIGVVLAVLVLPILFRTARDVSKDKRFAQLISLGWQSLKTGDLSTARRFETQARAACEELMFDKDADMVGAIKVRAYPILRELSEAIASYQPTEGQGQRASMTDIKELMGRLRGSDERTRNDAALALAEVGQAAIPSLVAAMDNERAEVRYCALFALRNYAMAKNNIALAAEDVVPILARALADPDLKVRGQAGWALSLDGWDECAREAIPALVNALRDADEGLRMMAATGLEKVGRGSPEAIEALTRATEDANEDVRHNALAALETLGPKERGS